MAWLALAALLLRPAMATAQPPQPPPFDTKALETLLAKDPRTQKPVESVAALIPLLPAQVRTNFVLVYESRSPFKGSISTLRPRVILFTDDARMVLTFTGDPAKPGYDLLEAMTFDDQTATFHFKAYLMPAAARTGWRPSAEANDCNSCHGKDPRPIFDSYPLWPGFYGSVLDTFLNDRMGKKEETAYKAFLAGPAKGGVYRDLVWPKGTPVPPFLNPKKVSHHTVTISREAFPYLPDARLGMALTELNRKRVYRQLAAAPGFAGHDQAFLAELLNCKGARGPAGSDKTRVLNALLAEDDARFKRLGGLATDHHYTVYRMQEIDFLDALAEVDDVARRAGADRSAWSMAMEPNSLAFFDGILSGIHKGKSYYAKEDLIFELLDHLQQRDPKFQPFFQPYLAYSTEGYPFGLRLDLGEALKACRVLARR